MKTKLIAALIAIFLIGACFSSTIRGNREIYEKYEKYKYGFIPYYSTIESKCSDKDREIAERFISLARNISDGNSVSIAENAGELAVYAPELKISEKETVSSECDFSLITADFAFGSGYIWSEYKRTDTFADGSESEKSYLSYWKLQKSDGEWSVTKIKEVEVRNIS